jgi:hypothetical protein
MKTFAEAVAEIDPPDEERKAQLKAEADYLFLMAMREAFGDPTAAPPTLLGGDSIPPTVH